MPTSDVEFVQGVPEELRQAAAALYDEAFGAKFAVALSSKSARVDLLAKSFVLPFAFAAICDRRLVGLAGFQTREGSLTGAMNYRLLISQLGIVRGNWAAIVFSLYERRPAAKELVMDGIAVRGDMRGRGIGRRLLTELSDYAGNEGYDTIRLDVIDTNPRARQLYERNGFVATKTERFGYLRWLLGFGASTTMIRHVEQAAGTSETPKR